MRTGARGVVMRRPNPTPTSRSEIEKPARSAKVFAGVGEEHAFHNPEDRKSDLLVEHHQSFSAERDAKCLVRRKLVLLIAAYGLSAAGLVEEVEDGQRRSATARLEVSPSGIRREHHWADRLVVRAANQHPQVVEIRADCLEPPLEARRIKPPTGRVEHAVAPVHDSRRVN
jgi:hypothetical protein